MKEYKKIILDETRNKEREVVCGRCDTKTNHKVLGSVELRWGNEDIQGMDDYEIIKCAGCDQISFRVGSSDSDTMDEDEKGEIIYPEKEEIYPSRLMGRSQLEDEYILPEKVRTIYKETHAALCTKLKVLAGVGIRALIEAVCAQESAKGRNLEKKIDDLVRQGVLTKKSASVLHRTRLLGNQAAHEVKVATDVELDIAFDIVENLLETVYIIPLRAEKLLEK